MRLLRHLVLLAFSAGLAAAAPASPTTDLRRPHIVLVMADDPALRQARLGLLGTLRNMVLMTGGDIAEIAPDTPTS